MTVAHVAGAGDAALGAQVFGFDFLKGPGQVGIGLAALAATARPVRQSCVRRCELRERQQRHRASEARTFHEITSIHHSSPLEGFFASIARACVI